MVLLTVLLTLLSQAQAQPTPAELFDRGTTWKVFLEGVRLQKDTWVRNSNLASAPADMIERLKKAGQGLTVLAVAEGGCSDSVQTIPYIAQLVGAAGIELRIVSKAEGLHLLADHKTPDGRTATPTVFILRDGKVSGVWVERPAALQTWFISMSDLTSLDRIQRKTGWYEWDRGDSTRAEFMALMEKK